MSQSSHSPVPQADDHGFDPLAFWIQYRAAIRGCVALLLVAMVGYAAVELVAHQKRQAAAQAFALAKTSEQWKAVMSEHSGSPAAGNAALLLAGKQRAEGQLDESLKTLSEFVAKSPGHPLVGSAYLATASILEQQGKLDDAIAAYRRLASIDSRGMNAPVALLRMARIYRDQNKIEEAKSFYESLQSQFPNSSFAAEALQEGQQLSAPSAISAPDALSPAAPAVSPKAETAPAPTESK